MAARPRRGGGRRTPVNPSGLPAAGSRPASRPVVFVVVGVAGYVLQTAVLWLLVGRVGLPVVPATLLATEAAVLHNFVWHLRWTWADRPTGPGAMATRLLRFNLANGGVSLAGGAALMALLVDACGMHYLGANLVTVVACGVVNYLASDRWVFTGPDCLDEIGSNQIT